MRYSNYRHVLVQKIELIEQRIRDAAARSGRKREDVRLIAVTKKFSADVLRDAYAAGLRDFGENYVQEFEDKYPQLADMPEARYHLIGHLQSNKTKKAAELFQTIQTVDSVKLARRLDAEGKALNILIEVKVSDEAAKAGASPDELPVLIETIRSSCPCLRLQGLMTMPPWSEDPEQTRPYFARLRELASLHQLPELSMGMSHDLEAAIEEGATMIRVGRGLFGPRNKP
jgi:pyridoxal phosphate enzyme (YggS family)